LVTAAGQWHGPGLRAARWRPRARTVVAHGRRPRLLDSFVGVAGIRARPPDVLDDAAVTALLDELPALDVLFNCAGYVHHGSILDCSPDDWTFSMNLNVRAMYATIRAALPKMLERHATTGTRRVDHQHGLRRRLDPRPRQPVRLRHEQGGGDRPDQGRRRRLRARGIRCNAIAPGTVDTPSLAERINAFDDPVAARKMFIDRQPMGRLAQGRGDRASWVYLASDESVFATGQVFAVDGGMTI
jgi:2-keto-3-deoxy-L-fuconate dehydrogenase